MANVLFTMADVEMAHFADPGPIHYVPTTVHYEPGNLKTPSGYTPGYYTFTNAHHRRTPKGYVGIREVWRSSSPKQKAAIVGATALVSAGSYLLNREIFKKIVAAEGKKQQQKQKRSR